MFKKYSINFTNTRTITNVLTASNLFTNIGTSLILLLSAFLLDNLDMNQGYIVFGFISLIVMILILLFMKNRVGLRPEEYKEYSEDEIQS